MVFAKNRQVQEMLNCKRQYVRNKASGIDSLNRSNNEYMLYIYILVLYAYKVGEWKDSLDYLRYRI